MYRWDLSPTPLYVSSPVISPGRRRFRAGQPAEWEAARAQLVASSVADAQDGTRKPHQQCRKSTPAALGALRHCFLWAESQCVEARIRFGCGKVLQTERGAAGLRIAGSLTLIN